MVIFVLSALVAVVLLLIAAVAIAFLAFRRVWRRTRPNQVAVRGLILAAALGLIMSLFFAFRYWEYSAVVDRVPAPLAVASIEYRLEQSWGMGFMPGDNETGFVVYRLTQDSADWARKQGSALGTLLEDDESSWRATPVDDRSNSQALFDWHPYDDDPQMTENGAYAHLPTIGEYLEKYGFSIPIEAGKDDEANQSLQSAGSFYAYGKGGSVTIVDPIIGKVYFAYAG